MPQGMLTNRVVSHVRSKFGAMNAKETRWAIEGLPRISRSARKGAIEKGIGIRRLSVRQINPNRGGEVAIKLVKGKTAAQAIFEMRQFVEACNKATSGEKYIFQAPMVYAAGEHVLFMQVSKFPTLGEVFANKSNAKVNRVINLAAKRLGKTPKAMLELITIYGDQVLRLTYHRPEKIIFAGTKNGKMVFIPLI